MFTGSVEDYQTECRCQPELFSVYASIMDLLKAPYVTPSAPEPTNAHVEYGEIKSNATV